jgi:hypothetical protein
MNRHSLNWGLVTASVLSTPACLGQANPPSAPETVPAITLESPEQPLPNRIGLSYRAGINIKVDFRNLGGLQVSDPGPATGIADRNYDNGYNRIPTPQNNLGLTWYWGYFSPNSVQGDSLVLQSDATPATASSGTYQRDPQSGVELTYARELARGKHWRAGLEGAFGYTALWFRDNQTLNYFVDRTGDSFTLNGVIPPTEPYYGLPSHPAALIPAVPSDRTTIVVPGAATILGQRKLDADLFTLRLGPYLELPLSRKFFLNLSGGLTLGVADTRFSFQEQVLISDPYYGISLDSGIRGASGSHAEFLVGGYAGGNLAFAVSERVRVVGGVIYQMAGHAINDQAGKQSVLDLGKSLIFSLGATYSF